MFFRNVNSESAASADVYELADPSGRGASCLSHPLPWARLAKQYWVDRGPVFQTNFWFTLHSD